MEISCKISIQNGFFYKFSMQIIDNSCRKLLSQFFNTLLHISIVKLPICDLSTNSQKLEQAID